MKKPGRVKLTCTRCGAPFSTHSSNRDACHKCLKKCREKHYFTELLKARAQKEKQEKTEAFENKGKEVKVRVKKTKVEQTANVEKV